MFDLFFLKHFFSSKNKKKKLLQIKHANVLAEKIKARLPECPDRVPVIIICYNNIRYVSNIVQFLNKRKFTPIIIDNASTNIHTLKILNEMGSSGKAIIIKSTYNFGHMVGFRPEIYPLWPEHFAYTDPDLELNPILPDNFIEILISLTEEFKVFKAGFALTLDPPGQIGNLVTHKIGRTPFPFTKSYSIREWEEQFWSQQVKHDALEIYGAPIDTTFAVYNKSQYRFNFVSAVRVAGSFSAVHLPWFPALDIMSHQERDAYFTNNVSASWLPDREKQGKPNP
ncbi:MAG: glycosyltransferase family 2 protein [Bacteroidetes bacterium]|nr:glycosyltransferase family 2 protein [Bacteroidota bacterium]